MTKEIEEAPKKFEIWEPVPTNRFAPADQDMAVAIWHRGRKSLVFYLTCYGGCHANVSLRNGGSVDNLKFEDAWKWFCSDQQQELPRIT